MYGAANVFRGSVAVGMFECGAWPDPAPSFARLPSLLGEEAFGDAWEQGRAMTMDKALAPA